MDRSGYATGECGRRQSDDPARGEHAGPFKPSFDLSGQVQCWKRPSRPSFAFPPLPVLRTFAQPSLHRIAVNIAQLFHKLREISNVEIVVPSLSRATLLLYL